MLSQEFNEKVSKINEILDDLHRGNHTDREFFLKLADCDEQIKDLFSDIEMCKNDFRETVKENVNVVQDLKVRFNEITNKNDEMNKEPFIKRLYYFAMINVGLVIPTFSIIGSLSLFFYMRELGYQSLFYDTALTANTLIFSFVIGILFFFIFLGVPIFFIYIEIDKIKNNKSKTPTHHHEKSNNISDVSFSDRARFFSQFLIIFVISASGFLIVTEFYVALIGALVWTFLVFVIRYAFIGATRSKEIRTIKLLPVIMIAAWFFYLIVFAQYASAVGYNIYLFRIFSLIGFNEAPSWQKLSQDYLDRSGFGGAAINRLKATFSHPENDFPIDYSERSVYLYGTVVAKTANMKILCTAHGQDLICQEFMNGDLISVRWLKDNSEK